MNAKKNAINTMSQVTCYLGNLQRYLFKFVLKSLKHLFREIIPKQTIETSSLPISVQ